MRPRSVVPQLIDYPHLAEWLKPRDPAQERVIDAFEEALVALGVEGASFAKIAEQGGFPPSLIQHHFGNRAQLYRATLDRVIDLYSARVWVIEQEKNPLEGLLDWFFSPFGDGGPPRIACVVDAFIALANRDTDVRTQLSTLYVNFASALQRALDDTYPGLNSTKCYDAAYLIVCLAFGRAGMDALGVGGASPSAAREACDTLIAALLEQ
ncbi:MAG: AcrR family transcriptional regulator [Bradymonadia bacterium]